MNIFFVELFFINTKSVVMLKDQKSKSNRSVEIKKDERLAAGMM